MNDVRLVRFIDSKKNANEEMGDNSTIPASQEN